MSRLLIEEPPLQVLPTLAAKIGLNEAIALQQLHYWLIHTNRDGERTAHFRDGRWWVYNSYEQWQRQFPFWSARTVRRVFTSLESKRVALSEQLDLNERDARKWYTIDYEALESLSNGTDQIRPDWPDGCGQNEPMDMAKVDESMSPDRPDGCGQSGRILHAETTTENTTENTHTNPAGVFSKHDLETCRKYAQWLHDTKQGIKAPFEGYAVSLWRTGFKDKEISAFLAGEKAEQERAAQGKSLMPCNECGKMVSGPCSDDWIACPLAKPPEGFANAASQAAP
jgi:hypothetical protein